jgi:hypothetical protein
MMRTPSPNQRNAGRRRGRDRAGMEHPQWNTLRRQQN